jgi:hypothetical protein
MMGLIVAATISQLEQVANDLRELAWERILNKFPVNPEFYELGVQFFAEESKHAKVFDRYIDMFATSLNVEPDDLKAFLPQARQSVSKKLYQLNSLLGGMSMWWLIAAFEEESIFIYKQLHAVKNQIDPLYYEIHRAHYEEESRHKSYAFMMLQLFEEFTALPQNILFKKIDFALAELINVSWTMTQLSKVKGLRKYKSHHPFFSVLETLFCDLQKASSISTIRRMVTSVPFISNSLHLAEYAPIRKKLDSFGAIRIPLPNLVERETACTR